METTTIAQGGQSAALTELKSYTLVKGFHHSSETHTINNIKENHKKGRTQEYTYYKNVCEGWGCVCVRGAKPVLNFQLHT